MTTEQLNEMEAAARKRIAEHINRSSAAHMREWRTGWKGMERFDWQRMNLTPIAAEILMQYGRFRIPRYTRIAPIFGPRA